MKRYRGTIIVHQLNNNYYMNPLTLKSDQDRISPYVINTIASRQVLRIKKNINRRLWSSIMRTVWQTVRRITNGILRVKRLNKSNKKEKKKRTLFLVCRSKRLLSQVIKLRASSWSSSPAVGTSFYFPPNNGYALSKYGVGLVGYLSLVK